MRVVCMPWPGSGVVGFNTSFGTYIGTYFGSGVVGFNTYFGTTASFHDAGTDELFSIIQRCKLLCHTSSVSFPNAVLTCHAPTLRLSMLDYATTAASGAPFKSIKPWREWFF